MPFSAQDVCFNAESSGCNGGTLYTPWSFIHTTGVVTGGQYLQARALAAHPFFRRVAVDRAVSRGPTGAFSAVIGIARLRAAATAVADETIR